MMHKHVKEQNKTSSKLLWSEAAPYEKTEKYNKNLYGHIFKRRGRYFCNRLLDNYKWMNEWMNEWMDGWMDGRMDEWMTEWMNEWIKMIWK